MVTMAAALTVVVATGGGGGCTDTDEDEFCFLAFLGCKESEKMLNQELKLCFNNYGGAAEGMS